MLTAAYVAALLANASAADRVWYLWNADEIDDQVAFVLWNGIALSVEPLTDTCCGRCDSSENG
jgi:hypothetical protein